MVINNTSIIRIEPEIENLGLLDVDYIFISVIPDLSAYIIQYSFSIDNSNWSDWDTKENIQQRLVELHIEQFFIKLRFYHQCTRPDNITTIYQHLNTIEKNYELEIKSILYDSDDVEYVVTNEDDRAINQYPIWNFYNNQDVVVKRWVAQCNAISEMYGHACIYFKTVPVDINSTLQHTHTREVAAVKKIMIMFPNNEIGNPDKVVYSDWDMPLSDEFIAHIVWEKFKLAFGDCIPDEKDYIYLPLLNKMYRIGTVQPVNKFMGKIAWFEVQLLKYEEDSAVSISQQAYDELGNIKEFESILSDITKGNILQINGMDDLQQHEGNIIDQTQEIVHSSERTNDNILHDTVIEKRHATDNYQNKLLDSTQYISLKETEKCREFMYNRLDIVQVKPDTELFPVSMYDLRTVPTNTIAIQYSTSDFSQASKNAILPKSSFKLSFDLSLVDKFSGNLISLLTGDTDILSISTTRGTYPVLKLKSHITPEQEELSLQPLDQQELYNIEIVYDKTQYIIKLYRLENKCKVLVWSDILPLVMEMCSIDSVRLYGGRWLSTNIYLSVDNKEIINDTSQPIRQSKV